MTPRIILQPPQTHKCLSLHSHTWTYTCIHTTHAYIIHTHKMKLIQRPKQDQTPARQTPNPETSFPASGAHDRIIRAPKPSVSLIPPALPPRVHTASPLDWLYSVHAAFPTGHPISLPSPLSWDLHCNPCFTFYCYAVAPQGHLAGNPTLVHIACP